jgi:hypothetical protein
VGFGDLSMKPDFNKMTNQELRKYVLTHREEIEPLRVLFSRRTPDSEAILFHPPETKEEEAKQLELFQKIVEEKEKRKW